MRRDTIKIPPLKTSFLSCEKDAELIVKHLFVSNQPYGDELKRLLLINTKDCLDKSNQDYDKIVKNTSIKELIAEKYFTLTPRLQLKEHEEVKSYIILTFDHFEETSNPEFRDFIVSFDILCNLDCWELEDFQVRPIKIAGIIDGILNGAKLTGIGELQFINCARLALGNSMSGYSINFLATHGYDDKLSGE